MASGSLCVSRGSRSVCVSDVFVCGCVLSILTGDAAGGLSRTRRVVGTGGPDRGPEYCPLPMRLKAFGFKNRRLRQVKLPVSLSRILYLRYGRTSVTVPDRSQRFVDWFCITTCWPTSNGLSIRVPKL